MTLLEEARGTLGNRTLGSGRLAARRMFLAATACYQAGKSVDGDAILAKAMQFMRTGSLWFSTCRRSMSTILAAVMAASCCSCGD